MPSSSDGVVTATVDAATGSILLKVNFAVAGSPISGTAANVFSVTVTESTTGNVVRGLSSAMAPGGASAGIDHEPTFGSPRSYVARAYNSAGVLLATSTAATATLPAPTTSPDIWLKSLSTPSMSVLVDASADNALDWGNGIEEGIIRVIERPDPIVVQDVRQYVTGSILLLTESAGQAVALDALLHSPGPYLLQMPRVGEPDRYVTVGNYTPRLLNPFDTARPVRTWSLALTQVARPPVAGWSVAIPGHTYADSAAQFPLYSNRTGTYDLRATS